MNILICFIPVQFLFLLKFTLFSSCSVGVSSSPLIKTPGIFNHPLVSGMARCSRVILHKSCPRLEPAISSKNLGSFQWEMVFRYNNLSACLCDWLLFMWTELENELCICFKWNIPWVFMKFQFKLRTWRFSFNLMDLTVLLPIFHTKNPCFQ